MMNMITSCSSSLVSWEVRDTNYMAFWIKTMTKSYSIPAPFFIAFLVITWNLLSLCNCYSLFCWAFRISAVTAYPLWEVFVDQSSFGIGVATAAWSLRCRLCSQQEMWTNDTAGFLTVLFLCLPLPSLGETCGGGVSAGGLCAIFTPA